MNEMNFNIDTAKGLTTYLKTVRSPIKIQTDGAEMILKALSEHMVELHTDNEGKLYRKIAGGAFEETTIDDVVDLACEYNYEDSYLAGQSVETASDFVAKCKEKKKLDELEAQGRVLNGIFYQTKYGRKVNMVADRICTELFTKLNLVPIYDVPFYEDRIVSEPSAYEAGNPDEVKESDLSDATMVIDSSDKDEEMEPVVDSPADREDVMKVVSADSPKVVLGEPEEIHEESKGAR